MTAFKMTISGTGDVRQTLLRHQAASLGEGFCPECAVRLHVPAVCAARAEDRAGGDWLTHDGCHYWRVGRTADGQLSVEWLAAWVYEGRTLAAVYANHPDYRAEWRP